MNFFILGFIFLILVSRLFTETLSIAPKALDLIDLAVIPMLAILAAGGRSPHGVDQSLHRKLLQPTVAFLLLCILSAAVNFERMNVGPTMLYIFGMLEGPLLFICMNKLINDKRMFGAQVAKFFNAIIIIEIVVVLLVSYPSMIVTGNPDYMSGTFGNNSYQFTALLILIGGYLIGKQYVNPRSMYYAIAIQFFVILTFLLLQYRTAVPAFFISYAILISILYGKRFARLAIVAVPIVIIVYAGFMLISQSTLDLKYDDLVELAKSPEVIRESGKFQAYERTIDMYAENPTAILFGCGPGTYVSRANYTFTQELKGSQSKGVGPIVAKIFGDRDYSSDVYLTYIQPLAALETRYGSDQFNNPNSSILALAAETGLLGLALFVIIYTTLLKKSHRYLRYAIAKRDPLLMPLASALMIGSIYLCLISPLDNYLEIARITLPIWLLFWTVSTITQQQRIDYFMMLEHARQEEAMRYQVEG